MKDFNTATDGTGTTSTNRKIQFLLTMLRGEALREFDALKSKFGSTTNVHIKLIKEGLLGYSPPINALNKQKRAMRRAIQKNWDILLNRFSERLTEMNNYLPQFPVSSAAKKMYPEELNEIILHVVPNSWAKKAYIQGWYFEGRSYKETWNIFEHMETAEAIYEGGALSKNTQWKESNRASSGTNKKEGAYALPSNPYQGWPGKRNINDAGHMSDASDGAKKTCLLHGPGNCLEECKVLKE